MPVRRVDDGGFVGYGSFGSNVTVPADKTFIKFSDELNNIIAVFPADLSPSNPLEYIVAKVYWRWKFFAGDVNADILKMYNARIGKRKYGTVIVEHRSYNSAEEFVAFPTQMSGIYATAFVCRYLGEGQGEFLDEIPCDEPPSDADIGLIKPGNFFGAAWVPSGSVTISAAAASDARLGDVLSFYPEKGLLKYNFGGSYVFNLAPIRRLELSSRGIPVVINI